MSECKICLNQNSNRFHKTQATAYDMGNPLLHAECDAGRLGQSVKTPVALGKNHPDGADSLTNDRSVTDAGGGERNFGRVKLMFDELLKPSWSLLGKP